MAIGVGSFYVFMIGFHDNKSDTYFKLSNRSKFLHELLAGIPLLLEPPKSHQFRNSCGEFIFGILYFSRSKKIFTPFVIKDKVLKKN